jgi:hypothetical protein
MQDLVFGQKRVAKCVLRARVICTKRRAESKDRVDKSMFRSDGWGNGRSTTSNVRDYALRQEVGISPPVIIPTQENDCRCRTRGCGDGHQRAGSGG